MPTPNVDADVLRSLHRIHRQLTDLRGRLDRGPKTIAATVAHVQHRETCLTEAQDELKTLKMAADKRQSLLKTGEDKIKEFGLKLNTASSNREYQAFKDHIAAGKMANSVLDDEILEAWDKIEQHEETVADVGAQLDKAREQAEQVQKKVTEEEPLIRADITRLEGELTECESNLPAESRDFYDRVVRSKGEDALATVDNQFCGGCHQRIPLNVCAQILLGVPTFCKSCGRLLYMTEDVSPDTM